MFVIKKYYFRPEIVKPLNPKILLTSQPLTPMFFRIALFIVLFCNISVAQLSVRNDNFVFVNDEIIFVEDDINLNESSSKIYLRNNGQLIQGNGNTGNSGIGELSVYQETNVGPYQYNYWCSPVGVKTNNNSNNSFGIPLLHDAVNIATSIPATYNSSSSFNGTSSPLNIEPYWIWKYVASSNYSDWVHVKSNTSINPGEGFTMKGTMGSGNAQRFDFRGKPNNGTIQVSVLTNQFTLVGNPYPSALDAVAYIHDPENSTVISGTLYYWEQNTTINSHYIQDYQGGYGTYTISADGLVETYTPAVFKSYNGDGSIKSINGVSTSGKRPKRYIPMGQGFMVEGISDGVVKAKNNHRVFEKESGPNSEFFKFSNSKETSENSNSIFSKIPEDYKRFRLNIDFDGKYTRQLVETFHNTATQDFDYGLESKTAEGFVLGNDAYFVSNDHFYIAEAIPYNIDTKINLTFTISTPSNIVLKIADIQNFESNQPIFIHDTETNSYYNLRNRDFNLSLEPGLYSERFKIVFKEQSNTLSIAENNLDQLKIFQNNNLGELHIINPNSDILKGVKLYDILGKKVLQFKLKSSSIHQTFNTQNLSSGVYIVKVKTSNRQIISKKVVISNKN